MDMSETKINIYDLIGIGIGPFNLGLAALIKGKTNINAKFLEQKPEFQWHPGMLIEGSTLQVPFLADLVSMVDPTSPYSFLNYLNEHGRLYNFYFLEKFHIPRKEYNKYCQWVSNKLGNCKFGTKVEKVDKISLGNQKVFKITVKNLSTNNIEFYYSKHVVLGIGSQPAVPEGFSDLLGQKVFHSSNFLNNKQVFKEADSVTVVGSGQSAAEVFYELLKEQEHFSYKLKWYTRSKGFFPMEYSKLGLEYFSPDYIEYFYNLTQSKKDKILPTQGLLYKGISFDTIAEIYDLLYEKSIDKNLDDVHLQPMVEVMKIDKCSDESGYEMLCSQWEEDKLFTDKSEIIVLATGYKQCSPEFLNSMESLINYDDQKRFKINKDYSLQLKDEEDNKIFVQNGELHTHGVGAPDLGLGAYRNAVIINTLLNKTVYSISNKNIFQSFTQ
ncbi:lysine N(6)-hydroxylase/L-ornithine N(5)-oxygenase family protein [Bacillus basilensis]|uniref:lysine N(6)-hydroxylase/L-ornithine N(5)-oxygenase family protein n=1 Tax=Bacillus cereus group TaxID=86661 RepID=UPI001C54FD6E|nr:lysine N(6)-hydroxylase/L-ornithine N(5)-oxygenase family protein [Bacillus toyonensis]